MTMMEMDDELRRELEHFDCAVEEARRGFGEWDICDPVVLAILRVVQAQNDFAHAIGEVTAYGADDRTVETAIEERRQTIAALQEALEREPRGFQ